MKVTLKPSVLRGSMAAPPSKSMAHRLLICGGLAGGESIIRGVAPSQDSLATLSCLKALGAEYTFENGVVRIKGIDILSASPTETLNCRECGSTLRFFIPLCLLSGSKMTLSGSDTLMKRPLGVYQDICKGQKLLWQQSGSSLAVQGALKGGEFSLKGNVSSQFVSGLLFALPLLAENSKIKLIPPVESRPYIDMTLQALHTFGIKAGWEDDLTIIVEGTQRYSPRDVSVEGDWSNAAFFEAYNHLGGDVSLTGLDENSLQGDKVCVQHLRSISGGFAKIDLGDCPDLGPILMAMAAIKQGAEFTNTARLKIKESDRGQAMAEELSKLGAKVDVYENSITVHPVPLHPAEEALSGHNDHRIVMALCTLLTVLGGSALGAEAVNKSLPDYFERLSALGAEVSICNG